MHPVPKRHLNILCTRKIQKSIPSPFQKRSTPKSCYVLGITIKFGTFFTVQGNSKIVDKFRSTYISLMHNYYHLFQCVRLQWRVCSDTFYCCCTQPRRSYRLRSHSWRLLCFCCCDWSWGEVICSYWLPWCSAENKVMKSIRWNTIQSFVKTQA